MKLNRIITAFAASMALVSFTSCDKSQDGIPYDELIANAVVTVKPDGNSFYLQLDDSTVVIPSNLTKSPFGDSEVRAFTNYRIESQEKGRQVGHINWMRQMLTKKTVASQGVEKDKEEYGNDAVDVVNAFPTVCEDGYLTLRFRTYWGRTNSVQHTVNLVTGVDASDPYLVEFRHNDGGDVKEVEADAYVSFRLSELPDTEGKTVKLKVRYKTPSGDNKIITFNYKTREDKTDGE